MRYFTGFLLGVLALALPVACLGQELGLKPELLGPDKYFPEALAVQQALLVLPSPPQPGTAAQAVNVQTLNTVIAAASPQATAQAQVEGQSYDVWAFSALLGQGFNASNLPILNNFFNDVTINTQNVNYDLKAIYNSPGPTSAATYPSTQALLGDINGMLLSYMIPEKAQELQTFGIQFGLDRLIVNAHWPTDVAAAQMETPLLLGDLFSSSQFVSDFNAAKAELRAQQGLK
jgi:acid phosphatase (class A)